MRCAWGFPIASLAVAAVALADPAGAPPAPAPEMLPTPYTAEQIRAAWQPGFRVEMQTRDAGAVSRSRLTVLSATEDSVVIREESLGADGALREPADESTAKWTELRDHASFAAATASRERAECRSQLGAMAGWRYVVPTADGTSWTMCFADATPGPPVEFEVRREGAVLSRMEHVSYGPAQSGAEEKL